MKGFFVVVYFFLILKEFYSSYKHSTEKSCISQSVAPNINYYLL